MNEYPHILIVDDDEMIHDVVSTALGEKYTLIYVNSGEEALKAAGETRPDVMLVSVEMPGLDGYEIYRRFRGMDDMEQVPVMFISAHGEIEDKLKGYDAGGDDYIVKPFNPQEFKARVEKLLELLAQKLQLKEMVNFANNAAMSVMSSMSEMGVLLEVLKSFNACQDYQALTSSILAGVSQFGVSGVVQIRAPQTTLTYAPNGEASPLEVSVISHMAGMDRLSQFKTRLSVTFPHTSLLVSNMPIEDADRCGVLRDHLAILIEAAEVRVQSISNMQESQRRGDAIERAVARITQALNDIDSGLRHSAAAARMSVDDMTQQVERALLKVALSEAQDEFMTSTIQQGIDSIINAQSNELDLQNKLTEIILELKILAGLK